MKKWWVKALLGLLVAVAALGFYLWPVLNAFLTMSSITVSPTLTVMLGGGGNTVILKSADNQQVLIVDTKFKFSAAKIKRYVDSLGPNVQVTIINTHDHADHILGNPLFPQAIIISGIKAETGKTLTIGDETVKIFNVGQAHAWDNLVVYFEKHQLLATGDLVFKHWVPVVVRSGGTHIGKWIKALEFISVTYPAALVVPGHGALSDSSALRDQLDYFTSITAAIGKPVQLAALEKKYADYLTLPGMSRIKDVAKAVEQEDAKPEDLPSQP